MANIGANAFPELRTPTQNFTSGVLAVVAGALILGMPPRLSAAEGKVPSDHAGKMARGLDLFKKHVRPLLLDNCVKCHGGEKLKGDLDITSRESLLRGGSDGAVIVVGSADKSLLYKLISHTEKPHMPKDGQKLPAEAIAQIATWIDSGAPYDRPLIEKGAVAHGHADVTAEDRQFWSFQPLRPVTPPPVRDETWCRTPIDQFILKRLEPEGLKPNASAERRKLIRRAYFDLIGLPPTPKEIDEFLADTAPDAYGRLIDRLLDNPHYGERWARHWLDVARFAESHGFEQDYDRPYAFYYRDFVIKALNQDMPYDRFVKWQLAGDEFAPDNPLALMATGFIGAGVFPTQITANEVEKSRYDALDDMAATTGTALLGLTVGCARCHDHKFDPIPTRDYYRFISTFTTTVRSDVEMDLHPEVYQNAKAAWDKEHAPLVAALEKFEREEIPPRFETWLKEGNRPQMPQWLVLDLIKTESKSGAAFSKLSDGSYLVSGTNGKFDTYTFVAEVAVSNITAVRIEALADPSMPKKGPGRAANGNFALTDLQLQATPAGEKAKPETAKLIRARATFEQKGLPVAAVIDSDKKSAWAVDPEFGKDHAAVFELEKPLGNAQGTRLTLTLKFENNDGHNIGRPRVSITTAAPPVELDGESAPQQIVAILRILAMPAAEWSEAQRTEVERWYRTLDPKWRELNERVQAHLREEPRPELTRVMIASEGVKPMRHHTQGADFFEETYFLKRGDLAQKQGVAPAGFLQVLMKPSAHEEHWREAPPKDGHTSYRRRSMANWITDTNGGAGHLLARVIVNRLWQHHFGKGIVATPNDFGAQGERPTHPELLDWLAGELIRSRWHLKPLHKLIMTSAVYRESADTDPEREKIDPENRWLWRRDRNRLEAEIIRDNLLAVSGSLDTRMFGAGTLDESMPRRSVYFFIKRSKLIPMMQLFDAPPALLSIGRRVTTTTAPQALLFVNNPDVRHYAHNFAKRLAPAAERSLAEAVQQGHLIAFGRPPTAGEVRESVAFLQRQMASYESDHDPAGAREFALTDFCQALMGLNEFIYVE